MCIFRKILNKFLRNKVQDTNAAKGPYMVTPMIDLNQQQQTRNGSIRPQTFQRRQVAPHEDLTYEDYFQIQESHYEQIRNSQMGETTSVSSQEYLEPIPRPVQT